MLELWVAGALTLVAAVLGWRLHALSRERRLDLATRSDMEEQARQLAAELERLEATVQAVLRVSAEGLLILDDHLRIRYASATAVRLLHLAAPRPEGRDLAEVAVDHAVLSAIQRGIDEGGSSDLRARRMGPGSGTLQIAVAPVGHGGWLVRASDLSERARLEAIRRDFVANVSHELRTPMASIRLMAETLREGAYHDPAVASRFLDTILAEADRLTRIADDLLVLSDAETKPPELRPTDLSEVCRGVVTKLRPQAARAEISLTEDIAERVFVMGDRDQLEQVVLNLLDNAIKYTPSGGKVRLTLDTENNQAVLGVHDTGIGIMAEHLPRIFERFYRVDKARSRQSGGTGLGLSIVKHIVESHGGSVVAESEYTKGSTFTVRLACLAGGSGESAAGAEPKRL